MIITNIIDIPPIILIIQFFIMIYFLFAGVAGFEPTPLVLDASFYGFEDRCATVTPHSYNAYFLRGLYIKSLRFLLLLFETISVNLVPSHKTYELNSDITKHAFSNNSEGTP